MERLTSLLGLGVLLGIAWLMSSNKGRISPRIILGGLLLQFAFALFVMRTDAGRWTFGVIDSIFMGLLHCSDIGSEALFGEDFREHFLAFKVLPSIIFFSALTSILYHLGLMQRIVGVLAVAMRRTLKTSGAETLSAAGNVFVGQTEAPLLIRPYISAMTLSELNAVMVGGFATIAGGVMAAYADMLMEADIGVGAKDLIAASVISAPAALMIAKIMQPEVDTPKTLGGARVDDEDPHSNVLDAIAAGTASGLTLALNVGAMLVVFFGLIAAVNGALGWISATAFEAGLLSGESAPTWSLESFFGVLFSPVAWLLGVPWSECGTAGELLGIKWFATEFVAYQRLAEIAGPNGNGALSERSVTIMTYALCGFSNFASIGIQLGGIGGMAPDRRSDLAKLALRAMIGGSLATSMTACIAGVLA